jgi:hypothetical protein
MKRLIIAVLFVAAPALAQQQPAVIKTAPSGNEMGMVTRQAGPVQCNAGTNLNTSTLATEATLAGVKAGTDKIPASPATDRATASAPFSMRLSDGAAFYAALAEATFTGRVGEVQSTPTVNTLLGRLKSIEDKLDALQTELNQKTEPANTQTVSGTVTATGPLTDTQLRATAVPVSGAFFQLTQPVSIAATVTTSDTHTTAAAPLSVRPTDGSAFYDIVKTGQLPAALDASGGVKTHEVGTANVSVQNATIAVTESGAWTFDQTKVNGVTVSTNNGAADTGTQRIVIAQELTYSAGTTAATATAAGTGVFFSICGSASKTIRIQRLSISGTIATGAKNGDVVLKRTSTATSGGTATTLTAAPFDSNNASATAVAKFYTVLATAGTMAMVVDSGEMYLPLTGTGTSATPLWFRWRDTDSEAPTLRGTTQCLEANFGTTTTNAPSLLVSVAWTEK